MKDKHIEIKKKVDCTGCRACEQICPVKCITMKEDKEGFIFPYVDEEKCINCGLCKKKCPQINYKLEKRDSKVYAVKTKEKSISQNSTSAGIAYILGKYIIQNNGCVFGCTYNDVLEPIQIMVENEKDLEKLRGSKYVFSNTMHTYTQVKDVLEQQKKVLYVGTPCQIAGLKSFLGRDYEELLLVDIVCHGVPSAKIFKKYIDFLEKKYEKKVVNYEFRNKDKARWGEFIAKVIFEDGTEKYIKADEDNYYSNFLKGTIYRECCYQCKYANTNRVGDITIGDFWGIEQVNEKFYSRDGVSLVLINSEKGKNFLKNLKESVIVSEQTIEQAVKRNGNLSKPTLRLEIRDNIYKGIDEENFINKKLKIKGRLKNKIKRIIPKKVKNIIKKII